MQILSLRSLITAPINQVIYLGAGIGQELPALLDLNAETIHLVEGDVEHQELLESEIERYPQVKLVKKLLSDRTGSATFFRYSLSELNSLQEGTGLQQLFPNVRLLEQQTRQTESLVDWLNTLPLVHRNNLLWIDLPGQEAIIIQHLIGHQRLDLFDTLILYAHQQPCYEGQQSIDQLRAILADQGYGLQQQNNEDDPDRPLLIMQRQALYWTNRELQLTLQESSQQLLQANALIAKLAEEKQTISYQLNKLENEKEALVKSQAELENQLTESQQSAKAKNEKITGLETQLAEAQQTAKANKEKVTTLEAQLLETQNSSAANNATIQKLKADLEIQTKEKVSLTDKLNQLTKEKETLVNNQVVLEKTLNEKLSVANQSAESKQVTITQLQKELAETKQSVQVKTEKLQQLEKQLTEQQQAAKSNQEKVAGLEKQLTESQQAAKAKQEKVTAIEAQLAESQKSANANTEAVNKLKSDLEALTKEKLTITEKLTQLADEKDKLNTHFQNRKKQAEEGEAKIQSLNEANTSLKEENTTLTKHLNDLKKQLEEAQQKIQLLETQLNAGKETQHGLSELQKQMNYLFEQNRLQLEQAANALGQHISHTGKQTAQELQTFVQCQQTLGQNTQALHYQDQTLTPEFALYINEKLSKGQFDVILVMGSGVLTQFIATQLQQGLQQQPRLSNSETSTDQNYVVPDQGDLPKRLLAFEHKKSDSKDLKKHLQQSGLQNWVNVSHVPLIESRFSGKDYLFYDLRKPLARLADVYEERNAKILILLSPNQASDNLNVEACLPALLQELSTHQLELILHPNTALLPDLKPNWQALLDSRDLEYRWTENESINTAQLIVNS